MVVPMNHAPRSHTHRIHTRTARTTRSTLLLAGLGVVLTGLAGCAVSTTGDPAITTAPSGSATTASAPRTSPSSTATTRATGSTAPSTGSAGGSSAPARCDVDSLAAATTKDLHTDLDIDVPVTITNTGTATCTLQGWPGVSFVGGGNGSQIGPGANLARQTPHPTVTLSSGAAAHFVLHVTRPGDGSNASCAPRSADGLRVIPPGSTRSLFVEAPGYQACSSDLAPTMSVTGIVAGAA